MVTFDSRVAIAFGLNIAAGLSTCVGALVVLNKKLVSLANPSRLGIALGLSAGVMIFISLVEIFGESVDSFEKGLGKNETQLCMCANATFTCESEKYVCDKTCKGHSRSLTTVCFIIGAALVFLLHYIVHKISPDADHPLELGELETFRQADDQSDKADESNGVDIQISSKRRQQLEDEATKRSLNRTGILTALAIGIHNLPEGIATFTAARNNPELGALFAISIALHNIPEGIAVATPVYYATKSKIRAFLWTFVSALAELAGGLIAWTIVGDGLNPIINGVMFGLVVGMMVTISLKELIPEAYHFCPAKEKVTYSILVGMAIMVISLILFDYVGATI